MVKSIIFDLDNTLYDMRSYLKPAYSYVASKVAQRTKRDEKMVRQCLTRSCVQLGYNHEKLFNHWLDQLMINDESELGRIIADFHSFHPTSLDLYNGARSLLYSLKLDYKIGILTDGKMSTQQKKIKLLGLDSLADAVIYSDYYKTSKPDGLVFREVLKSLSCEPSQAIYVGDHPTYDILGSIKAGILSVRICKGIYKELPHVSGFEPDFQISDLHDLEAIVLKTNEGQYERTGGRRSSR